MDLPTTLVSGAFAAVRPELISEKTKSSARGSNYQTQPKRGAIYRQPSDGGVEKLLGATVPAKLHVLARMVHLNPCNALRID